MRFVVVDQISPIPSGPRPLAVLVRDGWDDFGYRTMFHLEIVDDNGSQEVGVLKIGMLGMDSDLNYATRLPDEFSVLPGEYFSVGQDDTFYARLAGFGDEVRVAVLRGLRDMAFDIGVFEVARSEAVTHRSLWRFITEETIEGQYRRIALGGQRFQSFALQYRAPGPGGDVKGSLILDFQVRPDKRVPPTSIHVLTGRNGVGKSVLLNRMIRAMLPQNHASGVGVAHLEHDDQTIDFTNLVWVSFSAFDYLPRIPASAPISINYVGLREPSDESSDDRLHQLRSVYVLEQEFADSLEACLTGEQSQRWTNALETLSYPGSGLPDEEWLDSFRAISTADDRRTAALRLFSDLSSGHKAVLLTMTRLVELVSERTLVIIDEPETHLHPPLLSAFIRALSDLLSDRNGLAIVATHSPVVLQEVPARCVWKLRRQGQRLIADRPTVETFGENVGTLTHEVFGLEVTATGYHRILENLVNERPKLSYEQILDRFDRRLGGEARIIARSLIAARDLAPEDGDQ